MKYTEQAVETLDDAGSVIANKNIEIEQLRQRVAELEKERDALKQQRDELVVAATKAAEEIRKCDYTPARSTLLVAIASVKEKA